MDIKCELRKDISKKSGQPYYCIYIPDLEKKVFLEPTELKLIKIIYKLDEEI